MFVVLFSVALVISMASTSFAADGDFNQKENVDPDKDLTTGIVETPAEYIKFLEEKISEEDLQTSSDTNKGIESNVRESLKKFKELSTEDQKEFMDYINDPEVLDAAWDAMATLDKETTEKALYGGDIEVSEERIETVNRKKANAHPFAPYYTKHQDTRTAKLSVKGVNVARTYAYVQWTSKGDDSSSNGYCCDVSSINDTESGVVENLIPLQELSPSPRSAYISNSVGIYSVAWHIEYSYSGIGSGVKTLVHQMNVLGPGGSVGKLYSL